MSEAKELDKVQPDKAELKINGRMREFKFNFSAWAKIEKEYGSLQSFIEIVEKDIEEKPFTMIPHLMFIALTDKEGVTEETIFDEYDVSDLPEITEVFKTAFYGSLPLDAGTEEKKTM